MADDEFEKVTDILTQEQQIVTAIVGAQIFNMLTGLGHPELAVIALCDAMVKQFCIMRMSPEPSDKMMTLDEVRQFCDRITENVVINYELILRNDEGAPVN